MPEDEPGVAKTPQEIKEAHDALIAELYRFDGSVRDKPATMQQRDYRIATETRIEILCWLLGHGEDACCIPSATPISELMDGYVKQQKELFERIGVSEAAK